MTARKAFLVASAFLANIIGLPAVVSYSFGVYLSVFSTDYNWSTAKISIAIALFNIVVLIGSMPVGRLADRWTGNRIVALSMLAFGVSLIALPFLITDLFTLWLSYLLISVAGLGTTPVVVLKPVMATFVAARGTAIGLSLCGTGVGAMVIPLYVSGLIGLGGWQVGYFGLGALAIAASPLLYFGLAQVESAAAASTEGARDAVSRKGVLRQILLTRELWILSLLAVLGIFSVAGLVAHLVPLLRDQGASLAAAAGMASTLGLASIVGRLGTGLALDKARAQIVGFAVFCGGTCGVLLLGSNDTGTVLMAIMLIGIVLGAEVDLAAYLISQYFGNENAGVTFGWIYSLMALSSMSSPVLIGIFYDWLGTYDFLMRFLSVPLGISALLCLTLPTYDRRLELRPG